MVWLLSLASHIQAVTPVGNSEIVTVDLVPVKYQLG